MAKHYYGNYQVIVTLALLIACPTKVYHYPDQPLFPPSVLNPFVSLHVLPFSILLQLSVILYFALSTQSIPFFSSVGQTSSFRCIFLFRITFRTFSKSYYYFQENQISSLFRLRRGDFDVVSSSFFLSIIFFFFFWMKNFHFIIPLTVLFDFIFFL